MQEEFGGSIPQDQLDELEERREGCHKRLRELLERAVEFVMPVLQRLKYDVKVGSLGQLQAIEKEDIDEMLELYNDYSPLLHSEPPVSVAWKEISEEDMLKDIAAVEAWCDRIKKRQKEIKEKKEINEKN